MYTFACKASFWSLELFADAVVASYVDENTKYGLFMLDKVCMMQLYLAFKLKPDVRGWRPKKRKELILNRPRLPKELGCSSSRSLRSSAVSGFRVLSGFGGGKVRSENYVRVTQPIGTHFILSGLHA